jgi:hypothetical protein
VINERGFWVQDKLTAEQQAAVLAGTWTPGGPQQPETKPGVLTETITRCDETGRKIRSYQGDKKVWMAPFQGPMLQQSSFPIETANKVHFFYLDNGGKAV